MVDTPKNTQGRQDGLTHVTRDDVNKSYLREETNIISLLYSAVLPCDKAKREGTIKDEKPTTGGDS